MSAEATGVQIPISFSLEEAQLALRTLEAEARRAGKQIQAGTEQGSKGIETAGKGMMQFAREQRREAATARFFVSEFAAFLPVGSKFRDVALAMTEALVGGLGVGVAITAVTLGVKWLTQYLNEEAEAQKAAQKAAEDHAKVLRDVAWDAERYVRSLSGAPASLEYLYQTQHDFNEKTLKDRQRLAEIERDLARSAADPSVLERWDDLRSGIVIRNNLLSEQAVILGRVAVAEKELNAAQGTLGARVGAEEGKAAADAAKEQTEKRNRALEEERKHLADQKALRDKAWREEFEAEQAAEAAYISDREGRRLAAEQAASEARLALARDEATQILEMWARMEAERTAIVQSSRDQIKSMGEGALRSFASTFAAELGKTMTVSRAYAHAMKEATGTTVEGADLSAAAIASMVQNILASLAQQALVESLMMLARGWAYSSMGLAAKATAAFTAAGYFAATGALAGSAAMAIGATRGMTAQERAQVDAARDAQAGSSGGSGSGAREVGGTGAGLNTATRETIIVIGDPFETPAETARRAARRISEAKRLDMLARDAA